jgi:hypothetical protein
MVHRKPINSFGNGFWHPAHGGQGDFHQANFLWGIVHIQATEALASVQGLDDQKLGRRTVLGVVCVLQIKSGQ